MGENRRPVPKVSGLIKSGAVVPATQEAVTGLPDFSIQSSAAAVPPTESSTEQAPSTAPSPAAGSPSLAPLPTADQTSQNSRMIPLSRLKIHPFNSRAQRTQARIEEVRDMLEAENNQREPITVVPGRKADDLGYFYILSGQTRYHAANLAGWTALKAQVNTHIDPDDHLAFFAASIEHNTSVPETDWDLAVRAKALIEEGVDPQQVQRAVRRDERSLRRLIGMTDLPEVILASVREHPSKLTAIFCESLKSAANELGNEDAAALAREVIAKDHSQRELVQLIELGKRQKAKAATTAKRARKEFMRPVVVSDGRKVGEFKVLHSRTDGNRVVSFTADLPDRLAAVAKDRIADLLEKLADEK